MINISSIRPIIRHVALGIAAWLLIVSCGTHATRPDDQAIASSSACQMIQHAMGETCVPLNPERIVTIDPFSLENVLALGLQPAGYAIAPNWKNLDAVQNNQVYQVPSYWIGSSILTAHAVIDDLFNYLLETQP